MSGDPRSGPQSGVTVVIPVWGDYLEYLSQAVESVRIDLPDVRIVLVDNASEPRVADVDGATLVRSPTRLSVGAARNLGLQQVDSRYAFVLDVDDRVLPGTLSMLEAELDDDPSLSICSTLIRDGQTGGRHRNPRRFVPFLTRFPRTFALLECVWSFVPVQGCAMFRIEDARSAGGYPDTDWGDDWVLAMSLAFRGRVRVMRHFGRHYRATPDSLRAARGLGDDLASARLVRERVAHDPAIGSWACGCCH